MILSSHRYRPWFLIFCMVAVPYGASAGDQSGESIPQEGLLVLANGNVIEGIVARDADNYIVLLPKGKLRIRADQVDFLCRSLEEAYLRRRARQISSTAPIEARVEMAQWCISHRLFAHAEEEIEQARRLQPNHKHVSRVERLLNQTKELSQRKSVAKSDKNIELTSSVTEVSSPAVTEVPTWARAEFIKRIQPMLVNSCATAGCHVPNSSQRLQLHRIALDGVGNPELFQQNLSAVMEMVDLADPQESELLARSATAHGETAGRTSRPLTPHQLEIVRAWITQLSMDEPPAEYVKDEPRIAQIVIGMSSSARPEGGLTQQPSDELSDPFDPAAFNADNSTSRDTSTEAESISPEAPAEQDQE